MLSIISMCQEDHDSILHTMWKEWPQVPITKLSFSPIEPARTWGHNIQRAQSSPGYLHVGHVPSNWTRHIPQTSSSGMSHRQDATAFHSFMVTFMLGWQNQTFLQRLWLGLRPSDSLGIRNRLASFTVIPRCDVRRVGNGGVYGSDGDLRWRIR